MRNFAHGTERSRDRFNSEFSPSALLTFGTRWLFVFCSYPGHCGVRSSLLAPHPLDARSPTVLTTTDAPGVAQCPLGAGPSLVQLVSGSAGSRTLKQCRKDLSTSPSLSSAILFLGFFPQQSPPLRGQRWCRQPQTKSPHQPNSPRRRSALLPQEKQQKSQGRF